MKELKWVTKISRIHSDADVTITVPKEITDNSKSWFRFKNNSADKITDSGYIKLAVDGNKLFFAKADSFQGFKLSNYSKFGNACGFSIRGTTDLKSGDFKLEFDTNYGLFYVDLSKNLNRE